jgi:OOP family OmpA-OmpF porin
MKNFSWLLLAGALAAAPAAAQDKGLYAGGSVGQVEYADTCTDLSPISSCMDHDTGWRAFAGYNFNRNFALEFGYVDLGEVRAEGTLNGTPAGFVATATGFDFSALFSFGITERLSGFGRLGAFRIRTDAQALFGTGFDTGGETNTGFTYGAGVGYQLGKIGLRAEWVHYDNVGGVTTGEDTMDFYAVGLLWRF